jgi:hypothetical protein
MYKDWADLDVILTFPDFLSFLLIHRPSHPPLLLNMQAIKLQRKYPEVSQEDMFDLINRFKYVLMRCDLEYIPT